MPGGGVTIDTSGTSVTGAVDVGANYWRKKWVGNLYLGGSYTSGSGLNGYEGHVGDQMGERLKYWGLTGGLELKYNGYLYADNSTAMAPAFGVSVPIQGVIGPKKLHAYLGVAPSWYTDHSRNVLGPIDELSWKAGLAAKLSWATGKVGVEGSDTAAGIVWTPMVQLSIDGFKID
jgi:hypothetical protein